LLPRRRLAVAITTAALAATPIAALAQEDGTVPNLTPTPQAPGEPAEPEPAPQTPSAPRASGQLPNTGADARVLGLAGLSLLLTGVGLRMRTADERF
jgi:LPXTG-motif cell wall-anchored protein